ncbi:MAG TPA: methyltransferase [Dyella sp.]|uniref:class I SAM-dependent methyltransferase n=1 Tax=Dyella sp. TaxID=1869338 RepID=UPI002D78BE90|nr:methyltransferase [Dyella sp.]HET6554596.1 methyltransferase [Dyella sp.]
MRRCTLMLMTAGLAFALASHAQVPSGVTAAIADSHRPAEDRAQDADRHVADVLAFANVRPGDRVVDLMPGTGYYTRLFSTLVGPRGKVYALQPAEMDKAAPKGLQSLRGFAGQPPYDNVAVLLQPVASMSLPEKVDLVWTSQNYHDLHDPFMGSPDMAKLDRMLLDALRPGGTLIVLDHAAAPGTGVAHTDDLHRIDPAVVKAELAAAGFRLDGESDALRNPDDPHTAGLRDPSVRGHTDRFILRFVKP